MTLVKRKKGMVPFTPFPMKTTFDEFFDSNWPLFNWNNEFEMETRWIPATNMKESEKEFELELSIPGYVKKDVHVEMDNNHVLTIYGKREEKEKEETLNYFRQEFNYGSFKRFFRLPESIIEDKIIAKCENGILRVKLPKKDSKLLKKETKEVKII